MALLSTYQKFKEKNAQGNQGSQSEPQKQEAQKESSGSGLMSTYQQFMSKKQGGTQAVSPAQDYNQRVWDVLQKVDSANASRNGGWSADVTGGNSLEINALLREYDAYEGDKSGMTDYRNMLLSYNKQMQELNGYYSKFRDSDDYDRQRSGYGNFGVGYSAGSWGLSDSEAREIRKQQSQKDAQESQRALAEYTAAKKEFAGVDQEYRIHNKGDSDGGAFSDEYDQELTDRWNAAKAKVDSAENALRTARDRLNSYNATWGKVDQYAGDAAAAKGTDTTYRGVSYDELTGWESRRQEEQAAQDAQTMMPDYAPGTLKYTADTEPQVDDALGLWRSMTQEQRQDAVSSSNGQLSKLANKGAASYWDLLTDDEVSTYYYIRNQRGQEAANQYLDDMYIELTRRNEAGMVQGIENASKLKKAGMVAASVGANLLGAIPAAMGTTADLIAGRKNPYSGSGLFKRYASYVRGTVGQDIGDWTEDQLADKYGEEFAAKAGELANQTFQAVMSGVDSVAGGMTFGQGVGIPVGPFDMHVGGYTTIMGLGAFADRAQEMQLKGASTAQIALGAIGSGVLEALFEDVSMEAFFTNILDNPATTLKEFTKKLAVQMGVEASEEVFTEIGNILWDGIVMGKNSDTETATREYMAQGMTEQGARQRATLDNIQDIVWAGYGGAISAGAMAVGGQAIGSVAENYAVGKELQKNGRAGDLQEQAESLTNEKKRAKLQKAATEAAHNASVGDKSFRNTYRTGKVATQIAQQAGREARGAETAEFRKAAEKYLEGQRGIQNKKHALNVLTRAYDGTAMLPGDKAYMRMIGGEKLSQEILNSVGGKETLQENAKPSVEASMRTIGNVQSSVLGIAPETKAEFDSDNSGQAFRKSDSEPINILSSEPIAKVENGILYLNTDDGQEIAASDVSYGNSGEAAVYAAISNMQTDTETARSLLNGIDDSGLSSAAYARAIRNAYYRGMNGVKFEDTLGYSDAAKLPEAQRRAAWEAGKQRRAAKVQEQEALIDSGKAGTRESGVTMQESAKRIRNLNKQQQTGMAAAKALAAVGLHVEVYASTEAERKAGKPNGIYRKADGSIAIDLNAGDNGQGAVAYALAHETTHFIKDYSPAKYEAYAELIIAAAENKGISYDSLLARQMARLSEMEEYKGLSETELQEIAYDETIAEMSETILTDTDAANRLSRQIYKQDRTLWQKIKDFFTGLVEKLRSAYKDSDPDSNIGRMLKRAVQDNAEIAQAWAEAVTEAGENYQLQDGESVNAGTVMGSDGNSVEYLHSERVTDKDTLDFLNSQDTVTTYKTMQLVDGKLYPPMAAVVAGSYEDYSELGKWEAATEHPELIKLDKSGKPKFTLNKGKGQGSLAAAYNPYMHSSNLVLNDQFSGAYTRPNLVTVECEVPKSELTSGYKAQYAKDSVGWHSWHTGTVAGALRQQTGTERQVFLSRWIKPVRIIPNSEVAQMYSELLSGTDIVVPDNVVPPALLAELKKAGVKISESGRLDGQKKNAREGVRYSLRGYTEQQKKNWENSKRIVIYDNPQQLSQFISDSIKDKTMDKKMYFGSIPSDLAARIEADTGVYVENYNLSLGSYEVRKILKDHGNEAKEAARGQRAIIPDDFDHITDVVLNPTNIALSEQDYMGKPAIVFSGENNGKMNVVAVVSDKRLDLFVQTVYTNVKKGNLATPIGEQAPINTPEANSSTVSDNSVPQQAAEVKGNVRYSARQETKNLVALHNLTEEKFLKTLGLGGFPMPSIAITKADIPHTNFGDITVVFGKDTIDPKANRKNAAYSADAWTPVVPKVEYEADSEVADRVYNRLGTLKNQVADYFQHDIDELRYSLEDRLNREDGEKGLVKSLSDNYALKAAFLEEQGTHIEQATTQRERQVNEISPEMEDRLLDVMDALGAIDNEALETMLKTTSINSILDKYGAELEKVYPGITKTKTRLHGVLVKLLQYLRGNTNKTVTETVTDGAAMEKAVDAAIDQKAYENWVKELFGGAEKSRGIYNGKDRYTPSGNLRSFKATHIPATLEGIVQVMTAENSGNSKSVSGFNGIGTLRAATAEEFKSIADMHKREGRLQNLTEEQVKQIQGNLENRLYQLMNAIDESNPNSRLSDNSFIRMDGIGENLVEIGESGNYTPENVKRVFARYGMEVNDQTAQEVVQLLFDVTQMPVNIFEAKPKRAVGFDEIKNVLIPNTASQKLIRELDSKGIPYQIYEAGNEAQRQQMVNQMEDIRFSDRNSQSRQVERLEKKNAELKAEMEYLKQVVKVQKSGNKAHILDRSSVNAIGKGLMESVNAKGSEFGKLLNDFYRALGTEDMSYEAMQDRAGELAEWLLEHHQAERDGYAQEVLDFLKKRRVSLSDGQIGDIEYTYGSLNDFKRAIKGSIILDQNAQTSLDQLWQEAAAQFPDRFGADVTESNMPDGLAQIVSWANSAESSSEAEFQYYRAEQKADLTQKILMGYLEAKPMESVSDSMKKKLDDLKAKHKAEMAELRQKGSQALEAERQRNAAAIATMKAAQRAVDIAQKGLWETERQEIKHSYEQQMKELKGQYSEDTGTMQKEFFRLLREYEKQQTKGDRQSAKDSDTISTLREALSKEAKSHKEDSAAWNKEFSRLLREYEASGRKVDRLEAKVKQQRQAAEQKVESRKKTEERHKLQNTIDTLNKYLLQPTNTAHVPQGLQSSVAMALRAINGVIGDSKAAQNADRLAEYAYRLRELEKNPSANRDKIADLNRKIQNLTGRDSSMKAALGALQEQYHKLETQGDSLYDSNIEKLIQNTMEQIGDTEYRNLSLQQLKAVRDSYTALLTTIRNANKAFVAGKNARIDEMVQRATIELSLMKKKKPNQTAIGRNIEQFFWNNEKPVYAFERIGSAVMSELYDNLRKGEDTFYRDVSEARDFFLESAEKNGFSKWDLNELKEFTAADGQKFQLSLDELMSLYAYSLRPQAREHLTKGGIVLGENTKRFTKGPLGVTRETTYNDANAYTLTDETVDAIAGSLTKEQRQFAFEMQQYLAKIMGAKGDEVNMALYGIQKFGEETYWPLKSSDVFSERVRAQQENPGNKLKNKGFTKALTPKANNAIELSTLTETWAEHVSDMSMYHSFTLPMEDFYRVYNWNQKGDGKVKSTMGVRQMIQKTAGKGAVNYIDQFLKDLNGGLRADPRETVSKAMLSGFKKAAVSASLSVAIQQPSAVGRALAYIEPKYFIGGKVEGTKFAETWEQLKKYAAVAGLKEMGRFDVDMGRSTLEYIIGRNGLSTWGKVTDKVDEFSGWLPEMADQVTWCAIWEAAKRKTQAQNPGLHGEALLQKAGALFTDTITRTQVYDSVFSRSANMRAKSGLMSMATAFMAEPTTTANMVEDAIRKFQKGDKRMSAKMLSSVAVATVLNAALAAVVYAARDDDKDKTYWEKYLASLAGETADSFNPLTYVPIVADINNLLMGYSIERTDMSLASDLVTALKKIATLYQQYDDDWDEDKKAEWKKKVESAWVDNVLMAGTVTGLPLKNIYRDAKAAVNVITNPSNGAEMSADTILNAMLDSAKKSLPVVSWIADESSSDQLYKAITQGKTVLAKRLKAQFKSEAAYESAVLKGLRENDPRIAQAAQYLIDGQTQERVKLIRQIVAEGHYTQDQVIKAINQKANSMKEKSTGSKQATPEKLYDYSEYVSAAANGLGYAGDVREEMISYQADRNQEKDGKLTRQQATEEAEKTFRSGVKREAKDGYSAGELTEEQARKALLAVGYWDEAEVDDILLQWNTELTLGGEIEWSDSKYLEYAQEIEPAGISAEIYDEWLRAVKYDLVGEDADGDGEIDRYSAIKQKAAYINALPLTAEQKDALFATVTDSAKTRRKYKLW